MSAVYRHSSAGAASRPLREALARRPAGIPGNAPDSTRARSRRSLPERLHGRRCRPAPLRRTAGRAAARSRRPHRPAPASPRGAFPGGPPDNRSGFQRATRERVIHLPEIEARRLVDHSAARRFLELELGPFCDACNGEGQRERVPAGDPVEARCLPGRDSQVFQQMQRVFVPQWAERNAPEAARQREPARYGRTSAREEHTSVLRQRDDEPPASAMCPSAGTLRSGRGRAAFVVRHRGALWCRCRRRRVLPGGRVALVRSSCSRACGRPRRHPRSARRAQSRARTSRFPRSRGRRPLPAPPSGRWRPGTQAHLHDPRRSGAAARDRLPSRRV